MVKKGVLYNIAKKSPALVFFPIEAISGVPRDHFVRAVPLAPVVLPTG